MVGARRTAERRAQSDRPDAALLARGRLARPGGARRRAVRPGAGEYSGAAVVPDGAAVGGTSGAWRHGGPVRSAGEPGPAGPGRASSPGDAAGGGDRRRALDDAGAAGGIR